MSAEHIALQFSRGAFARVARARNEGYPDGVSVSVGCDEYGKILAVQAVHFDSATWGIPAARKWLTENRFTRLGFIAATEKATPQQDAEDIAKVSASFNIDVVAKEEDKHLVFGWLYVCRRKDGTQVVDHSGEIITMDELEPATYGYVLDHRKGGAQHEYEGEGPETVKQTGRICECMVFAPWKKAAMGIPDGILPDGTWIGQHIDDAATWARYKSGELKMFSLGGYAIRQALRALRSKKK